jgi:hypothetical protein
MLFVLLRQCRELLRCQANHAGEYHVHVSVPLHASAHQLQLGLVQVLALALGPVQTAC